MKHSSCSSAAEVFSQSAVQDFVCTRLYSETYRHRPVYQDKRRFLSDARTKSQINFLADSLTVAREYVLGARDICAEERNEERNKVEHTIVRREYYIECTCGYEGPALNGACAKCGTQELAEIEVARKWHSSNTKLGTAALDSRRAHNVRT